MGKSQVCANCAFYDKNYSFCIRFYGAVRDAEQDDCEEFCLNECLCCGAEIQGTIINNKGE
jgi:hypothetical protein